jgi:SUN domain-containing protein 1/2
LESVLDLAKRTAFYLRQRSTEPEVGQQLSEQSQNGHQGNDESYDYAAEDREFREQSGAATTAAAAKGRKANNAAAAHKRNAGRISVDNRAYRPTQSDLEQSDEDDVSDDGKRRRRKGKKNMIGPLTTLPVVGQERKRRRRKSTKADGGDQEGEEDGEGEEEEDDSASEDRVSPPVRRPAHARLISCVDSYFGRIAFCPFISASFPTPRTTKTPI